MSLKSRQDSEPTSKQHSAEDTDSPTATPHPQRRTAYRYTSLKGVSDAEIIRFMGGGNREWDRAAEQAPKARLPDRFWADDAKEAALDLVEANRSAEHLASLQIALEDRGGQEPPARSTIAFTAVSPRCYNAVDAHYFLRVDPEESYLAYARSSAGGVVFYSAVHDQPAFDFRRCRVSYDDARKIADVIWWLDHVGSRRVSEDASTSRVVSTGDGSGKVTFRSGTAEAMSRAASLRGLPIGGSDEYDHEAFLNFAAYLLIEALPARLGSEWSRLEPTHQPNVEAEAAKPAYSDEERRRLAELAQQFLAAFDLEQSKISFAIVAEAARLAATFPLEDAAPQLRVIEAALPPPGPAPRSYEEIEAEKAKLTNPFEVDDPQERQRIKERAEALDRESDAAVYDPGTDTPDYLRRSVTPALRQLAAANDPEQLYHWAVAKSDDGQWAFQRLAQIDQRRYADALEALLKATNAEYARQFFAELARVNRDRAVTIARDLPPGKEDVLAVSAFLLLRATNNFTDENERVGHLLRIIDDPKSHWAERGRAIDALVPRGTPLRYTDRRIDQVLMRLLEPRRKDESFVVGEACEALALRRSPDAFERIALRLKTTSDTMSYATMVGALAHLAQADPQRLKPRLRRIVEPHLSHTNKSVIEMLWTIWAADLRDLLPKLEQLATESPDEFEDMRASSYGGDASTVTGRFHLARKIVSLWRETDPLTSARLLAALCAAAPETFVFEPQQERVARLQMEAKRRGAELPPAARQELAAFLAELGAAPDFPAQRSGTPEQRREAIAIALSGFAL